MKRILALIVTTVMVFFVEGCGNEDLSVSKNLKLQGVYEMLLDELEGFYLANFVFYYNIEEDHSLTIEKISFVFADKAELEKRVSSKFDIGSGIVSIDRYESTGFNFGEIEYSEPDTEAVKKEMLEMFSKDYVDCKIDDIVGWTIATEYNISEDGKLENSWMCYVVSNKSDSSLDKWYDWKVKK